MSKNISITLAVVILLIVVAVVGIVVWRMQSGYIIPPTGEPATASPTVTLNDSTSAINQSLENIDVGDLDKEFQEIDSDLNSL